MQAYKYISICFCILFNYALFSQNEDSTRFLKAVPVLINADAFNSVTQIRSSVPFYTLSKAKLIDLFEVTTAGAVGHYFNGVREPKIDHIIALSEVLDMPIAELLGVSESEGQYHLKESDETHLTDALRFLCGVLDIKESEIISFFNVYQKIRHKFYG